MGAAVHQLFSRPEDVDAAWQRYAELAKAMQDEPRLKRDRAHVDATLSAFAEYQRLFLLWLEADVCV